MRRALALVLFGFLFSGCGTNIPLAPIFDARDTSQAPHVCRKTKAFEVGGVPLWRMPDGGPILFVSKMAVSADGAPNAYHPADRGTDKLSSGGVPGNWWAVATDDGSTGGRPLLQRAKDPFPGYYISMTSLFDPKYSRSNPRRFVDARNVPYFVLPHNRTAGAELGDVGVVYYPESGRISAAIFADVGAPDAIGEGSIRLARNLGIDADPRSGGVDEGVVYVVFPGSGRGTPMAPREIKRVSSALFNEWGGEARLKVCLGAMQ